MNIPSIFFKTLSATRTALYFGESLPLSFIAQAVTGKIHRDFRDKEKLQVLLGRIQSLIDSDSKLFADGSFPLELLQPQSPIAHLKSFSDVLIDAIFVAQRMKSNKKIDLPESNELEDLPSYYQRNFHFQSDGYLSSRSAKRYNHQVDILFSGTTDMMRRMTLKRLLPKKNEKLKILELACGVGSTTKQWAATFKNSQIIATDLSKEYLSYAKKTLHNYKNVDFVRADATDLPFKKEEFDVVFHVYLFHELPKGVRSQVMKESLRVLKTGGTLIVADSLQLGDHPDSNWALKEFPKTYHEPFFTDYIKSPLEALFQESGLKDIQSETGFLTKSITAHK